MWLWRSWWPTDIARVSSGKVYPSAPHNAVAAAGETASRARRDAALPLPGRGAHDASAVAEALGHPLDESRLWPAPDVALEVRGLASAGPLRAMAANAAVASFVANQSRQPQVEGRDGA